MGPMKTLEQWCSSEFAGGGWGGGGYISKILQMWKKGEPKEGAIYLPRRWPSLAQMHQCHPCDIDVVYIKLEGNFPSDVYDN